MPDQKTKAHCPKCGPDRNCISIASETTSWEDEEWGIWGKKTLSIVKCLGCEEIFIQRIELDWDDLEELEGGERRLAPRVTYWPATSKREQPSWVHDFELDHELVDVLREVYAALDSDLHRLAAIGMRTAFDLASGLLGIKSNLNFSEKTQTLVAGGFISPDEKQMLDILIDAGSAAAHRAWKPSLEQLIFMMEMIEGFIKRAFISKHAARQLEKKIPPRENRPKS
jgi:hypothetical protein